jgi:hypothetical protein
MAIAATKAITPLNPPMGAEIAAAPLGRTVVPAGRAPEVELPDEPELPEEPEEEEEEEELPVLVDAKLVVVVELWWVAVLVKVNPDPEEPEPELEPEEPEPELDPEPLEPELEPVVVQVVVGSLGL